MSHHPHTPHHHTPQGHSNSMHASIRKICITTRHTTTPKKRPSCVSMLATTIHKSNTTPHHQSRATTRPPPPTNPGSEGRHTILQRGPGRGLVVSKPNSVSGNPHGPHPTKKGAPHSTDHVCCPLPAPDPHPLQATGHPTNRSTHRTPTQCGRG
jgi:hypothetical protein